MAHSNGASKELSKVSSIFTSQTSKKQVLKVPWERGGGGGGGGSSNDQGLPEGGEAGC